MNSGMDVAHSPDGEQHQQSFIDHALWQSVVNAVGAHIEDCALTGNPRRILRIGHAEKITIVTRSSRNRELRNNGGDYDMWTDFYQTTDGVMETQGWSCDFADTSVVPVLYQNARLEEVIRLLTGTIFMVAQGMFRVPVLFRNKEEAKRAYGNYARAQGYEVYSWTYQCDMSSECGGDTEEQALLLDGVDFTPGMSLRPWFANGAFSGPIIGYVFW